MPGRASLTVAGSWTTPSIPSWPSSPTAPSPPATTSTRTMFHYAIPSRSSRRPSSRSRPARWTIARVTEVDGRARASAPRLGLLLGYLSLAAGAAEGTPGGLAMLAQVEVAMHDLTGARDHGAHLTELEPGTSYPYQILGDALLELGDYGRAAAAYRRMERLVGRRGESRLNLETRLGRLAFLHGQTDAAERHLSAALASALERDPTPRET